MSSSRIDTMKIKLFKFLVFLLVFLPRVMLEREKRGRFNVVIRYFEDCSKEDATIQFQVRSRKLTHTWLSFEGKISNSEPISDDVKLKGNLQKFTPSGWKENYLVFDWGGLGACSFLKKYFDQLELKMIFDNIKNERNQSCGCPAPPGEYEVSPIGYDSTNAGSLTGFPRTFFYGQYRSVLELYNKDYSRQIGCLAYHFDLVPKHKRTKWANKFNSTE